MIGSVTAPKITAMTDGWVQGNTQTDLRQPREHSLSSLFFSFYQIWRICYDNRQQLLCGV